MKNTGEALFITDFVMVLAACFSSTSTPLSTLSWV